MLSPKKLLPSSRKPASSVMIYFSWRRPMTRLLNKNNRAFLFRPKLLDWNFLSKGLIIYAHTVSFWIRIMAHMWNLLDWYLLVRIVLLSLLKKGDALIKLTSNEKKEITYNIRFIWKTPVWGKNHRIIGKFFTRKKSHPMTIYNFQNLSLPHATLKRRFQCYQHLLLAEILL